MPIYGLKCDDCGTETERYGPIAVGKGSTSCPCGSVLRRVWTPPAFLAPFRPHFNMAVGRYVRTDREFRDALKQGSEEASRTLGMDVNYQKVDIADTQPLSGGIGLEETAKHKRDTGQTEPTRIHFT